MLSGDKVHTMIPYKYKILVEVPAGPSGGGQSGDLLIRETAGRGIC